MDSLTPPLGHNNPPDPIAELVEKLKETHADTLSRADELLGMGDRLPASCDDDATAEKLANAIKTCTTFAKNAESARVAAKEPHLAAGRAVDGFFKKPLDAVEAVKKKATKVLTDYQRAKADAERRERERLAKEAEEKRRAEEAERRAAEAAARKAREEAEAAERAAKAEADRLANEAKTKAERAAAEKARQEAEERAAAAKAEADRQAAEAKAARDRAAAAREEEERKKAEATQKAAKLTSTHTDLGASANLRTTWHFEIEDPEQVPRAYLTVDEAAVRVAIKAATTKDGKCPLKIPGIVIFAKTETVVR